MKNRLSDLNNHLFAQIERLSDEKMTPEQVETESKRGVAIVAVADQILRHATLQVQTAKMVADHGQKVSHLLPKFGGAPSMPALIDGQKQ